MVIALFAALGFGSIVAAWIARLTVISGFRQAWINTLRDDFAEWMKEQHAADMQNKFRIVYEKENNIQAVRASVDKVYEARIQATMLFYRISTRLNLADLDHKNLYLTLRDFERSLHDGTPLRPEVMSAALISANIVFKREWEVTKWGFLAGTMTRAKAHWRFLFH